MARRGCGKVKILLDRNLRFVESESRPRGGVIMSTMRATAKKKKMISLKQIRSAARVTREARETLKALGLGKLYDFHRLPDTKEVRSMVAKVGHLVSILDGPDILFPTGKSTLGVERIREAVEAVRAEQKSRT
jgi:large subunit ribosomal protein L30